MEETLDETIERASKVVEKKAAEKEAFLDEIRNTPVEQTEPEPTEEDLIAQVVPSGMEKNAPKGAEQTGAHEEDEKRPKSWAEKYDLQG